MKILVVEDDSIVAQAIKALLVSHHYAVDVAPDGLKGLEMTDSYDYDLLLLDIGLPGMNGVSLCQQIRNQKIQTPILMLTGQEIDARAKAAALNAGADDYVTKPFDAEELLARVQTLLRRGDLKALPVLRWGALSLDPSRLRVSYGETLLHLTPKEFSLLEVLLRYAPNIVSAHAILEQCWSALEIPGDEAVRTHLKEVRKKLKAAGAPEDFIKTVHRRGYRLNPLYGEAAFSTKEDAAATLQTAELKAVNEELRQTLKQLQATQTELEQRHQEVQAARDDLSARMTDRTAELSQDTQRLQALSTRLIGEADIQTLYEEITATAIALTHADAGTIQILEAASQQLLLLASQGLNPQMVKYFYRLDASSRTACGIALATRKRAIIDYNVSANEDPSGSLQKLVAAGFLCGQSTPLMTRSGRVIGMVSTHWRQPYQPSDRELRFLDLLARQAADLIEQRQTHLSLQASETQLSRILDNVGAAIGEFVVYPDRSYVHGFYSVGCEAVYGYTQAEIIGDKDLWLSRVVPEDVETVILPAYEQIFAEENFTIEYRFRDKTDTIRWLSESLVSRWDEAAECWQVTTMAIDISDRKASEAKLSQIINSAIAAIASFRLYRDGEWGYEYFSAGFETVFGYTAEELMADQRLWWSQVWPEDRETILVSVIDDLFAERDVTVEFRFRHRDGSIRWISASHTSRQIADDCWMVTAVNTDISDRKQSELALQESEAKNRTILAALPDLLICFDANGRYREIFETGCDFEVISRDAVGQSMFDVLPADLAEQAYNHLQRALQTGELQVFEQEIKFGNRRQYEEARVIKSGEDEVLFVIRDITNQKNLEAQFYQAQRLESLGTLAGGIAHDLNNVLTPILTTAQLLRLTQKNLDAKGLEQVNLLETSAKRGANLVKQILSVTRASTGERTKVDLAALLQDEIEIIQQSFPKTITIQADFPAFGASPPALGIILADPTYLHQVILNLCVNARDAMPDGGTLTLSAAKVFVDEAMAAQNLEAQVGDYAVITIADTGTGITPEVQACMFDPFFTTKTPGQGTGLGLTTVRGLVKAHQGFLQVFSQVGQGTQFKVYLPLIAGDVSQLEPTQSAPEAATDNHHKAVVLVVEDEPLVRSMLQALLETHHYRPLLTQNGAEALELYQQHPSEIQLVVTDLMMPIMDGVTFIKRVKAINPEVPVIAISGVRTHEERALAAGANCFVAKPFDLETLLGQISTLLNPVNT